MRKELSMIYVTGDTHANIDIAKLNTTKFPQQKELTKNDFVIIFRALLQGFADFIYYNFNCGFRAVAGNHKG